MRFIFIICFIFIAFKPTQCKSDSTNVEEWTVEIDNGGSAEQKPGINRAIEKTDKENYTKSDLKEKIATYTKMKRNGFKLAGTGGILILLGIILVSRADWETKSTSTGIQSNTKDPYGAFGISLIVPGASMSLVGLILGGIGTSKVTEYRKRLKDFSIGFDFSKGKKGLKLCYDF